MQMVAFFGCGLGFVEGSGLMVVSIAGRSAVSSKASSLVALRFSDMARLSPAVCDEDTSVAPANPDSPYHEGGTAVLERPKTEERGQTSDDGDADRFAHYVTKGRLEESRLTGRPVVALCGKIWKPKHDPSKYPVCPECRRIYEEMVG